MDYFANGGGAADAGTPTVQGYAVGRGLGRGSSAGVWLVTEERTRRDFALKCFELPEHQTPKAYAGLEDAENSVRREIRILSVLDHEHLVKAHDVVRLEGDAGGRLGLIMDYAAGGSLGQLVAGRGSLGPGETVTVLTPIAQALAYLHGQGFTHGDVSPGNVLFTAHGKPLLADLGVARMVADARAVPDAGTEGFRDPAPVDAVRAGLQPERDVYSLAALGWYCLTGRAPEPGAQRPPLPLLVPGVPPALAAALESGLHEDRRLRPSAAELASAVHRSAVAAPVDLSVSVHPTVIPQLLTRRIPPGTARERRVEELRSLPRRFRRPHADTPLPGSASPAAGNPADAGPEAGRGAVRPGARHSTRRGANGRRPFRRGPYRHGSARPGPAAPSATRPVRPGRRGIRAVAVGLALLAVVAAAWGLARAALPVPFPGLAVNDAGSVRESAAAPAAPAPSAAAALPPGVQAQLASQDPEEAVRGLAWLRSLAFSSGEFGLLDQVNVPASAAATADGRISGRLKESGRVLAGFTTLLTHVARDVAEEGDGGPSRAVVAVTAGTSAYQERDATGAVLADAAAAPEQELRLVLATVEGRWRIQDILPAAGAPAAGPQLTGSPGRRRSCWRLIPAGTARGDRPPGTQDFGPRSAAQAAASASEGCCHSKPASLRTAGSIRWLESSSSSASLPITRRSTGAGTRNTAGRCRALARAAISEFTSALSGAQRFTGPESRLLSRKLKAPATSGSVTHGQYCRPLPSGPPTPRRSSGMSRPSAPPERLSTTPVRGVTTRTPAGASCAAASQSAQIRASTLLPAGAFSRSSASPALP